MIIPGAGEPVVTPRLWVERSGFSTQCDGCILVFWDRLLAAVKNALYDTLEEEPKVPAAVKGVTGRYGGARICAYRLWSGAPASAMAMEFLIAAGVRKFVVFGGCGAIHPSVKIFDIVIPTWGVREEGTSYHYIPPETIPRPGERAARVLVEELRDAAQHAGVRVHVGGIWSIDAVFRETRDKIRKYSSMGALCVDMESTALMAIAMYRGVELGLAHIVTDELYGKRWRTYSDYNRMAEVEKSVAQAVVRALARI